MKEAMFYEKLDDKAVQCNLCHHRCKIPEGKIGVCSVRKNQDGTLYSLVYGKAIAAHPDPIEKKPLFHFQPGARSMSIATAGCNFRCSFCQNADIAHMPRVDGRIMGNNVMPEEVVRAAEREDCRNIAYTYTEPTIFFEYAYDIAKIAKDKGLKNVFVSNGYMTPEVVDEMTPLIDAVNVDIKAFSNDVYKKYIGGELDKVLETVEAIYNAGIWIEITTLIIPTLNDGEEQMSSIVDFIAGLSVDIPWHISRFHPSYKLTSISATPLETLQTAGEIGREKGLHHIYIGNVWGGMGEDTICWNCGKTLIKRVGFSLSENKVRNSKCPYCDAPIAGVDL